MQSGKVKSWDAQRGFGFIVSDDDDDLFVNVSDIHPSVKPKILREGQNVKFDVKSDMKGDRAVNVRVAK
ncbi:MAG: cold shock domain-containing protein [Calditrichaeota bacterium]|nr:MAG: cold shock domain-containing protein [Calditrichota bacterium]MBL1207622.1 cold shock domain-containing protein [Calditrichota bacterium]NOG47455.1 cold shock domain-containing protein [Calditrichota bacterium]